MEDYIESLKLIFKALKFSAQKHKNQRRKGPDEAPYINHPIEVCNLLISCHIVDLNTLIAAILHDTIEDTDTIPEEIKNLFSGDILKIVEEVTDDKSLPKEVRKRLQIETGGKKSIMAKQIKIADKICNVTDIMNSPPAGWSLERKIEYFNWAEKVVNELKGVNTCLEKLFQERLNEARKKYIERGHDDKIYGDND